MCFLNRCGLRTVWSTRGAAEDRWIALRNIVVAPITEEVVYRSVLAPALYIALINSDYKQHATWAVVWLNPLWFAMAHLHHMLEKLNSGWSLARAGLTALVQLTYTTIFGVIATLLLLRTGSIYTSILSHCICNCVGLPDVSFLTAPGSRGSSLYSALYEYRNMHLFLHAAGLVLFTVLILPLTESYARDAPFWK
jgi:membrane protease YdiL (CAAX protease family)